MADPLNPAPSKAPSPASAPPFTLVTGPPLTPQAMIFWSFPFVAFLFLLVIRGPYVLCLILLRSTSNTGSLARITGIAFGLGAVEGLLEGLLFLFLLPDALLFGKSQGWAASLLLFLSFAGNAAMVIGGFRVFWRSDTQKRAFASGVMMALSYATVVILLQQEGEGRFLQNVKGTDQESESAAATVRAISWCAL